MSQKYLHKKCQSISHCTVACSHETLRNKAQLNYIFKQAILYRLDDQQESGDC